MSKEVLSGVKYQELLVQLKQHIRSAQAKAALAVNTSLIQLYWNTGKMIAENQALFEGRNSYVDKLAKDLQAEFPDIKGFSKRNIFYCRKFYFYYSKASVQQLAALNQPTEEMHPMQQVAAPDATPSVQQPVGLNYDLFTIPWGHHILLLDKTTTVDEALFYIQQTLEHNWSRAILTLQIEQNLFARQGKAINNFKTTLPEQQAQMAAQILKDPYNFGFLTMEPKAQELDIEKQLTEHITKFLLELGKGFAFIGRQYPMTIGVKDYRLDLLFYHIRLRCFIVIDLKSNEFEPEFAGKMNFYLSAVDDLLKTEADQPSIGIILCKNKNKLEVEYALRGMSKPIGVSEFTLTQALPTALKSTLPTIEEFENELNKENQ
jgi:predicted nuclease of restriction endonuclease-like (RecB) superfamily